MNVKTSVRRLVATAMMVAAVGGTQLVGATPAHASSCVDQVSSSATQYSDLWWGNTMNSDATFTKMNRCLRVTTLTKSTNWFNGFRGHLRVTLHNAWGSEIHAYQTSYLVGANSHRYDTVEHWVDSYVASNTSFVRIQHWAT